MHIATYVVARCDAHGSTCGITMRGYAHCNTCDGTLRRTWQHVWHHKWQCTWQHWTLHLWQCTCNVDGNTYHDISSACGITNGNARGNIRRYICGNARAMWMATHTMTCVARVASQVVMHVATLDVTFVAMYVQCGWQHIP